MARHKQAGTRHRCEDRDAGWKLLFLALGATEQLHGLQVAVDAATQDSFLYVSRQHGGLVFNLVRAVCNQSPPILRQRRCRLVVSHSRGPTKRGS